MQATSLDLDPSGRVPIDNIRQGKSFGFTVTFEEPVTNQWEIVFSEDEAGKKPVIQLTGGNGFSIDENVITVFVSAAKNKFKIGKYWFRMSQIGSGANVLAFIGPVTVSP